MTTQLPRSIWTGTDSGPYSGPYSSSGGHSGLDRLTTTTGHVGATPPPLLPYPTSAFVDDEPFPLEAIVGGVIAVIVLLLCCCAFLVARYMFKNKGSYLTYESGDGESLDMADTELQKVADRLEIVEEE